MERHVRRVQDPAGVEWSIRLEWEVVRTEHLRRAIAESGRTIRPPRFWERGRKDFRMKPSPVGGVDELIAMRPTSQWEQEHSDAWLVVAKTTRSPSQARAWMSPAARRADARDDLNEIARMIERGDDPGIDPGITEIGPDTSSSH
jgi:hypothetical protein